MKYGYIGAPTTLCSVLPLAGIWVCFWWNMMNRCAVISARISPGISSTCRMYILGMIKFPGDAPPSHEQAGDQHHAQDVHPRDDQVPGERAAEQEVRDVRADERDALGDA